MRAKKVNMSKWTERQKGALWKKDNGKSKSNRFSSNTNISS